MNESTYLNADATTLASMVKQKAVTPVQLLQLARDRLLAVDNKINAITHQFPEMAEVFLAQLKGDEPFYGVPIVIKELGQAIPGLPMRCGSRFLADNLAHYQHDFIGEILSLGFIPFAMTNTPEFGLSFVTESQLFGPCCNPYDLSRTSGGSSGGSAAAVATGIVPVATASDGGGSIRIPAACCGLVGFKPSSGVMPTGPLSADPWSGMAVSNVVSRTLRDTTTIFNHLHPNHAPLPLMEDIEFVIGGGLFAEVPLFEPFQEAFDHFSETLQRSGFNVIKKTYNLPIDAIGECVLTLIQANICADITRLEKTTGKTVAPESLEPATWVFYEQGKQLSAADLIIARDKLFELLAPVREGLSPTQILISPVLAQPPLPLGQLSTSDSFESYLKEHMLFCPYTGLYNQSGMPAISLPYTIAGGYNFSVQLGARKGYDHLLLFVANSLMQAGITKERQITTP